MSRFCKPQFQSHGQSLIPQPWEPPHSLTHTHMRKTESLFPRKVRDTKRIVVMVITMLRAQHIALLENNGYRADKTVSWVVLVMFQHTTHCPSWKQWLQSKSDCELGRFSHVSTQLNKMVTERMRLWAGYFWSCFNTQPASQPADWLRACLTPCLGWALAGPSSVRPWGGNTVDSFLYTYPDI